MKRRQDTVAADVSPRSSPSSAPTHVGGYARWREAPLQVLVLLVLVAACVAAHAAAPTVSNVRASQRPGTKLVDITYDLADPDSSVLTVSVVVSTNGGSSYTLPATSFTGAVGSGVARGSNKTITWNAGADWNGRYSANVRFLLTADDANTPVAMAIILAGSFTMGNCMNAGEASSVELPLHTVYVSAFYMDKYEVTKALWDDVYNWGIAHTYSFEYGAQGKANNHPAHSMTWYDAVKWCNARSEKEGRTPAYYTDAGLTTRYRSGQMAPYVIWSNGYRLPTEAEWEKAARGGASGHRFPWSDSDTIQHSRANYYSSSSYAYDTSPTRGNHPTFNDGAIPYTSPVGYFAANGYGLYDMAGNVWEWCWDWYGSYPSSSQTDPRGPASGSYRVYRSGGWNHVAYYCRAAYRDAYAHNPALRGNYLGFRAVLPPGQPGNTHSAPSGATAVDTRDNTLAVYGRVLSAATGAALPGATVTLAGQSTTTSTSGSYTFTGVSLAAGNTLAVSKAGYASQQKTITPPSGATTHTVPDVNLAPAGQMRVTSVTPKYDALFLSGASLLNEYTAAVAWGGHTPSAVEFYVNGALTRTVATSSDEATASIDMGTGFVGSLSLGANKIRAVAVDGQGGRSEPFEQAVAVIPAPAFLTAGIASLAPFQFLPGNDPALSFEISFPDKDIPASALKQIPLIGKYGWNFAVGGGFEYALNSGEWQLHAGIQPYGRWAGRRGERPHSSILRPKFFAGNKEIEFSAEGRAEGTATQTSGIVVGRVGVGVSVDYSQEILAFYLSDYVPGARWARALDWFENMGVDPNSIQRVTVYGELGADLQLSAKLAENRIKYEDTTLTLSLGARVAYEPDLVVAKGSVYAGGKIEGEFKIHPSLDFNKVTGALYGGMTFTAFSFEIFHEEFTLIQYSWPSSGMPGRVRSLTDRAGGDWVWFPVASVPLQPKPRDYLSAGPEVFMPPGSTAFSGRSRVASLLEDFRLLGQVPTRGSVLPPPSRQPKDGDPGSGTNQVDLTLVRNAFPNSAPAMDARGAELMLLYVADNGSSNALQFTDIKWTRFDGANWSVPQAIRTNTQAEFAPQVKYDGNGDAVAVWERVADPNFNQTNLTAMAAQMEIVWSRWNRTNGAWSEPAALTANGYLDHAPLLCGSMVNGDLLVAWTKNEANLLMGTNAPGADTVLWARWDAAARSWSTPQTLVDGLAFRLSQSLAGVSNREVYAWTRDADGVLTNDLDQEVFVMEYNNGVWGATWQFTTNGLADKGVRAAVGTNGAAYLVWQQGTNLVSSRNFATNTSLVRADSQTAGFADYALTLGQLGHLVLLWQEMSTNGSDAHYAVYDPASDTWSKDALLCADAPLERSFAPVWDSVGNLTVAYNKVQVLMTNKTVTLEGGGTITITNVPQPGRVDLLVTKRALVKDLALLAGDFSVQGVNYLPGDPLTLSALVRNSGNVAVSNVVVSFFDGNPDSGGVLLTNVTSPGWLESAGTNLASALWIVPEPAAPHTLYAVVDQASVVTEYDETNSVQSVRIGGTDLVVSLVSHGAETNGALRVIAQVQNWGAPTATNSVLAIRREGQTNAPLATVQVPVLEPGRLAQVAMDLPPGTQPEGEAIYRLFADETRVVPDVDTNNNTTAFAVNLWVDSDGDGMPDSFERQFAFLNPSNPNDAGLDFDGDGVGNLAEYRAGTSPADAGSYLRMTGITSGGTNGVAVAWGSATNRLYTLQRTASLVLPFADIGQHLLSTPPENTFLDASATNAAAYFYRVKVE